MNIERYVEDLASAALADCNGKGEGRETADPTIVTASALLNMGGIRIMRLDGPPTIGVWSDLDGPEIRDALQTLGMRGLPVSYLDGAAIPIRYKIRRVEGEPVPMSVLAEMERHPAEPWIVRDGMLNEMGWCSKSTLGWSGRRQS